ncbi:centlein isoform X2 [Poeciliopsis prolifica]|uniref:centlein isoform X2 n=1 Tax=Poeciliopsis prolifica TaxID=188132 RepID=UPI002413F2E9|nr:centlein isoform X2 [Poeciliopsis prolifica]
MCSHESSRVLLLEEEVKNLSEELIQCQADKEFVWSLWKRLQVANPDLTQAVSLVVEREKQKTEMKDRKVLEILQSKDFMIQDLEQKVAGQQQEIKRLLQKKTAPDEQDGALTKEMTTLRAELDNKNRQVEEMRTQQRKKEEEEQRVVRALEEEKEGLRSRCAALSADLQEKRRQADSQRDERDAAQARLKALEKELQCVCQELPKVKAQSAVLAAKLSSKETELVEKQDRLEQIQRDFAEVQGLYKQSTAHAAEQSHLIKQLEGLNLDTQRVLRNQEEAHTADATSYQGLYKELSQCYQALVSSEAKLRQSHQELSTQVVQKDEQISELQAQLQKQQEQIQLLQQHMQPAALSPNRQTNFKQFAAAPSDRASTQSSDPKPEDRRLPQQSPSSVKRLQGAPVQRSRSLSPAGSVRLGSGRRIEAEQRIRDLEELLQLKTGENEELKKAHEKRRERLRLVQTNYKTIRDQMKEMEKSHGLAGGRKQRPEPWQLRQENSDAVWNELAYMKNLNKKLTAEKVALEEELDMLRVQSAMDRTTAKELRMCLSNDHQELLQKMAEEQQVKSSTPIKPPLSSSRLKQSFKKMNSLEQRLMLLEEQTAALKEERQKLRKANEDLANNCRRLQASIDFLRNQEADREEEARVRTRVCDEQHRGEVTALESRLAAAQKEIARLNNHLLKLKQELGIARAARDFYRNRAAGPARPAGTANISAKVKPKTTWHRGLPRPRRHPTVSSNQAISWHGHNLSPTKDEWEDMSAESDSVEEYSDSLNGESSGTELHTRQTQGQPYRRSISFSTDAPATGCNRKQDDKQQEPWERGTRGEKQRRKKRLMKTQRCSSSSLQQRVESLQRHIDVLQSAKKDALLAARELQEANEVIKVQLGSLTVQLNSSKQLTQKLTSDLAGVEQQKKVLEMELEQWKRITLPPKAAPQPAAPPTAPASSECSCQGRTGPALQSLEAEVKQLQVKLKSSNAEVTKQMAANKALRGQLQEKDDKLSQLQDKVMHAERDVAMKRQLVEDLKTRLKVLQDMERSYRAQVEDLEKKVKTLSDEASNRKALIESLKRRLNVATTEKGQHEASCAKLKEDMEKKEQQIQALQARVGAGEQALAVLEQTASEQMEGLTQHSSQALDRLQRRLGQAGSQVEQLHYFIKTLASEILLDVQEVKQQLMSRRRQRQASSVADKSSLSAKSMIKAKSIAASILNMSENDLADIMGTDQMLASCTETSRDQDWLDHLNFILQQKAHRK